MLSAEFDAHLKTGSTTMCRAWILRRKDGTVMGFTDHDRDFSFEGVTFKADTGLTASALEQSSGLAVNNTEALGALTADVVTEADLLAGRYDGAEVVGYLVNWSNPDERLVQFRGLLGEIRWGSGAFEADLRGLTELLNQPRTRVYHSGCGTDGSVVCGFDPLTPGYFTDTPIFGVERGKIITIDAGTHENGWFAGGRVEFLSGEGVGLGGMVKSDRVAGALRKIELWERIRVDIAEGDIIRVIAGCERHPDECRYRYSTFITAEGFPTVPGEDWLMAYPVSTENNDGGSLR